MTTHEDIYFDREAGIEKNSDGKATAVISSIEPLPPEIRDVFFGLYRKYATIT
jgi:hypothetical protein